MASARRPAPVGATPASPRPAATAAFPSPSYAAPSAPSETQQLVSYEYALLRLVPRVERGECLNVGVLLHCRTRRYLAAAIALDPARALALAPDLDLDPVRRYLEAIRLICAGDPAGGPIAALPQPERFGWLIAPLSTIVQPGPVHAGLAPDPAAALARLLQQAVGVRENDDRTAEELATESV